MAKTTFKEKFTRMHPVLNPITLGGAFVLAITPGAFATLTSHQPSDQAATSAITEEAQRATLRQELQEVFTHSDRMVAAEAEAAAALANIQANIDVEKNALRLSDVRSLQAKEEAALVTVTQDFLKVAFFDGQISENAIWQEFSSLDQSSLEKLPGDILSIASGGMDGPAIAYRDECLADTGHSAFSVEAANAVKTCIVDSTNAATARDILAAGPLGILLEVASFFLLPLGISGLQGAFRRQAAKKEAGSAPHAETAPAIVQPPAAPAKKEPTSKAITLE